eukprot:365429-Chlamydomonas_euryale.AAC.14
MCKESPLKRPGRADVKEVHSCSPGAWCWSSICGTGESTQPGAFITPQVHKVHGVSMERVARKVFVQLLGWHLGTEDCIVRADALLVLKH